MLPDLLRLDRIALEAGARSMCATVSLSDEHLICRVLGKYIMYADPRDLGITPHLALNGFWEAWVTLALARLLQPGWHCVDVGANVGYFTLLMTDMVGPEGAVLAVEPNPRLARWLALSVEINGFGGRVRIERCAAANRDGGSAVLVVDQANPGMGTICARSDAGGERLEVPTATLDTLTAGWPRIDLVKIDAEGAEPAIWQGMHEIVTRNPNVRVLLEFTPSRYEDAKGFLRDIETKGFLLRRVEGDGDVAALGREEVATMLTGTGWTMLYLARD